MSDKQIKEVILEAILKGDGDAYGVPIAEEIESLTGKRISIGKLYALLAEMEDDNLIASESRRGGAERGFRDKRCYRLTGHGLAEIRENLKA